MPYIILWDESTPAGSLSADQIDSAIQDGKIATRERLEQVIPGFGDDGADPKRMIAVYAGLTAERPSVSHEGVIYIDEEVGMVFYSTGVDTWEEWPFPVQVLRDTEENKPNPATAPFFFATDTNKLYVSNGAEPPVYVLVTGDPVVVATDITLEGLRVHVIHTINRTPSVPGGQDTQIVKPILAGPGSGGFTRSQPLANPLEFLPLGVRMRAKRADDADYEDQWSWLSTYRGMPTPTGTASVVVQDVQVTETNFILGYQVRNEGTDSEFDVESYLYLLALTNETELPDEE